MTQDAEPLRASNTAWSIQGVHYLPTYIVADSHCDRTCIPEILGDSLNSVGGPVRALPYKDLAEETGKSKGDISKLLKLLDLAPEVQRDARADATDVLCFKHLDQIARLTTDEQTTCPKTLRMRPV